MHISDETEFSFSHFAHSKTLLFALLRYSFTGLKMSSQKLGNILYCEDVNKKEKVALFVANSGI
jgi:hypothetical protein